MLDLKNKARKFFYSKLRYSTDQMNSWSCSVNISTRKINIIKSALTYRVQSIFKNQICSENLSSSQVSQPFVKFNFQICFSSTIRFWCQRHMLVAASLWTWIFERSSVNTIWSIVSFQSLCNTFFALQNVFVFHFNVNASVNVSLYVSKRWFGFWTTRSCKALPYFEMGLQLWTYANF